MASSHMETGRVLYNESLSVKVKAHDKDECVQNLTFKLRLDMTPSHHQVLLCDITDAQDPYFLYQLVLGESDFHSLKNEQRLLVDFAQFPNQMIKLLEESKLQSAGMKGAQPGTATDQVSKSGLYLPTAIAAAIPSSPATVSHLGGVGGGAAPAIYAVLTCVNAHEATFSITESNQFRELQHLSLHFREFLLVY